VTRRRRPLLSLASIAVFATVFLVPFLFIALTAAKTRAEANRLDFSWPTSFALWDNLVAVVSARNGMLLTAYLNSTIITVASVALLVVFGSMVGYVRQRRKSRWNGLVDFLVLAGLMMPPAVVPTIWLLQQIGLFATLPGMVFIQVAYNVSFCVVLTRAFVATVPRELDEAAIIDGAKPLDLFFRVILPLMKQVTVTNIVVQSVAIFNDFVNPLYYLPGNANVTVQLTLYNFQSQYTTQYNLLFTNILLVTIPPLVVFLFFNRQIVAGMTAGAVKG